VAGLGEASLYIFCPVELGKLTADFLIKFKAWIDRQNESQAEIARQLGISRQALTDQIALRKRPNAETLLRMQAMIAPPASYQSRDCRVCYP
jgi:DNA-binding XRE family transcriptional regulator